MARPAIRGVLALAFACCGAGGRALTAAMPPVVEHGWLGLSADAYGLYARPTPALASLHEDYQFLRHHDMPAGRLGLDSVAAFGDSAHVRLQPALAPHLGSTVASITLQLCGGNTTITLKVTVPESRTCASQKIFNNSNSAGWTTQKSTPAPNKTSASPAWCQALCCANPDCVGFTYTDPQPGDKANGDRYICWQYTSGPMKVVSGAGLCDGSSDGHCWSALGNPRHTGTWSVEVRERSISTSHLPPLFMQRRFCKGSHAECGHGGAGRRRSMGTQ